MATHQLLSRVAILGYKPHGANLIGAVKFGNAEPQKALDVYQTLLGWGLGTRLKN
jgi:hypothetical protein